MEVVGGNGDGDLGVEEDNDGPDVRVDEYAGLWLGYDSLKENFLPYKTGTMRCWAAVQDLEHSKPVWQTWDNIFEVVNPSNLIISSSHEHFLLALTR